MNNIKIGNAIISAPFFVIGAGFIGGAIWSVVSRLSEGLSWKSNDSFVVGAFVVLLIFGGAFIQFGFNALNKGYSKNSKKIISPIIYYFIGALFIIPGAWSALYGSTNAIVVLVIGIGIVMYGLKISHGLKSGA